MKAAEAAEAVETADAEVQTEELPESSQILARHQSKRLLGPFLQLMGWFGNLFFSR